MTTQQDCSIGISPAEATYGAVTTPTVFPEFTDETFDWQPTFIQGQGMRVSSRFPRSARRALGKQMAGGDFTMEAPSKGLGRVLQAAFGTGTVTQIGTTGVFQQLYTPTTTDYLNSYTIQRSVPLLGGGAPQPITLPGGVVSQLEMSCANSAFVLVKSTWNFQTALSLNTTPAGPAYAPPSYASPVELFNFTQGNLVAGGTVVAPTATTLASGGTAMANVTDFTMTMDNGLDNGGFTFNNATNGIRHRKPTVGDSALTGTMTAEFDSTTFRDYYLAQSDIALVLTFTGMSTIGTANAHPVLQIFIPDVRLEGELPKSNSGDVITQSIGWTGFDNLSGTGVVSVVYQSSDTAA